MGYLNSNFNLAFLKSRVLAQLAERNHLSNNYANRSNEKRLRLIFPFSDNAKYGVAPPFIKACIDYIRKVIRIPKLFWPTFTKKKRRKRSQP